MSRAETAEIVVPSLTRYLSVICGFAREVARKCNDRAFSAEKLYHVQLAVSEACTNVIRHGYRYREDGQIKMAAKVFPNRLELAIEDSGVEFDIRAAPPPNLDEPGEGGYGLFLIRQCVDEVDCTTRDGVNVTVLTFKFRS